MLNNSDMETIKWSGYDWIPQERWGQLHTDKPIAWYDPSCVNIDSDDQLTLKTHHNPKYFKEYDLTSPVGVGLISCTNKFGYGIFEIESKLPRGKHLWPAFWMWSWDTWPPEIDVFEGYSGNFNYLNLKPRSYLGIWDIQTNVHYIEDGGKMLGGRTKFFGFKDPTKNFIKYKLDWTSEYLKLYYNDVLVRTVTDPHILDQLSETTMNVVINNMVTDKHVPGESSEFIVNYFKYTPHQTT